MTLCHYPAMDAELQDRITDLGITQDQIAELFGITQGAVSKWFSRRRIPAERVLQVSELTGLSPNELRPDIFGQ